jgi:hypothetical protein
MTDFYIDSDQGRIGPFWWINSDTSILEALDPLGIGIPRVQRYVRWGTVGVGRNIQLMLQVQE